VLKTFATISRLSAVLTQLCCLALLGSLLATEYAPAQTTPAGDSRSKNLMAVIRETPGPSKPDETLVPLGKMKVTARDGKQGEVELASFKYLGDMGLHFVFDEADRMRHASPEEFERLKLSPEQALELAVANLKRVYGAPETRTINPGLTFVYGKSADYNSSYFLDRAFWLGILRKYPDGVVVAVPDRNALFFVPAIDVKAVYAVRKSIPELYAKAGYSAISSALYLFKDDRWSVFEPPQAR
jgi:uncharacterized protein YtpQ (UPF0354 family)